MDGIQHILQSIGRMGVIDDGCHTLGRAYRLQSAADTLQRAHDDEDVLGLFA